VSAPAAVAQSNESDLKRIAELEKMVSDQATLIKELQATIEQMKVSSASGAPSTAVLSNQQKLN